MRKRYMALAAAGMFALGMAIPAPHAGPEIAPPATQQTTQAEPQVCDEDMACFDCKTMGNGMCGNVGVAKDYATAYALCAELESEPEKVNACRWEAWRAFPNVKAA